MSSCLDSILHAKHKSILEEMRADYDLTHAAANQYHHRHHFDEEDDFLGMEDMSVDTRFQRAFIQLLYNAQFEELSAADLMLTSALNTDYLLTLPVYVDWTKASVSKAIPFSGENSFIHSTCSDLISVLTHVSYRRGYATERQKGLLIVEKLDYLQSKLLQALFSSISEPLGRWFAEALERTIEGQEDAAEVWMKRIKEFPVFRKSDMLEQPLSSDDMFSVDQLSDEDLPIWLAAQRAVARYEGILSLAGPRGRLLRKLLTWTGLVPSMPQKIYNLEEDITASEPYLRLLSLPLLFWF
ncbi:hypothetical protein HanPI659440_Chr16g0621311 [Helianthus annuus]|nr:hypothetical protein HanPI659440_Chr16g0621311 [Helianthus annuus]